MTLSTYLSFAAYACATTVLPGPNNVLLLAAAGQFGFRRCIKLLLGIWSGLVTVMLIAGGFCSALGTLIPSIAPVFKYVGAAYILFLAYKTFRCSPIKTEGQDVERPLTYWNGFLLQFLNVKVIMLGLASYPGYFLPYGHSVWLVVLFALTMTACCGLGNLIWAAAGSLLCPLYNRHYKVVNGVMALLLVYCAAKIIFL
ncbi:MAG: LysE family transporter [Lachnospiraceae bacterium]|nr:LysE family transporter [Lachnospiraceae bacterium]